MIWDITETELSHLWESQKYDMIISSSKMGCTFFTFTVGYNSPLIRELWDMGGSWLPDVGKKILHLDLLMPQNVFDHLLTSTKEEFEDTKGVIRIRKSKSIYKMYDRILFVLYACNSVIFIHLSYPRFLVWFVLLDL